MALFFLADDWKSDGFQWVNNGNDKFSNFGRCFTPNYRLKEGEMVVLTKPKYNFKEGKRRAYRLHGDDTKTLVHYFGSTPTPSDKPHGNAKFTNRPYIRTAPSVLHDIKEASLSGQTASKTYTDLCANVQPSLIPVLTPRDTNQVFHTRQRLHASQRLGNDEILNTYLIAHQLVDFVKCIDLYPEFVVVFANDALVQEFASMMQTVGEGGNMYVGYDTTFNLGDFYVSIVTIRHFMFRSEPIVPVMFMLHSRKYREMHHKCWSFLFQALPQIKEFRLPVVTDREKGILDAIEISSSGQNATILCWNHIKKDVKRWLTEKKYSTSDIAMYIQHVTALLQAPDEHKFDTLLKKFCKDWSSTFSTYFSKHLESDIKVSAARWVLERHGLGNENGITNNISESMNNVIKAVTNRKEHLCDHFLAMMHRLQEGYLQKILRGFCGMGDMHLKGKYSHHCRKVEDITWPKCLTPEELVEEIKKNLQKDPSPGEAQATRSSASGTAETEANVIRVPPAEGEPTTRIDQVIQVEQQEP